MSCKHLGDQVGTAGCCGKDAPIHHCDHFAEDCVQEKPECKSAIEYKDGSFGWVVPGKTKCCDGCEFHEPVDIFVPEKKSDETAGQ
jgi:hypothetical protein